MWESLCGLFFLLCSFSFCSDLFSSWLLGRCGSTTFRKPAFACGWGFGNHLLGLFVGDLFRFLVFRNLGVFLTVGDIRAVATVEDFNAIAKVGNVLLCFRFQFCGV